MDIGMKIKNHRKWNLFVEELNESVLVYDDLFEVLSKPISKNGRVPLTNLADTSSIIRNALNYARDLDMLNIVGPAIRKAIARLPDKEVVDYAMSIIDASPWRKHFYGKGKVGETAERMGWGPK